MTENLTVVQPRTAIVELVDCSGIHKVGDVDLFVFYEQSAPTSMLVRVVDVHPTCMIAEVGKVYITKPFRDREWVGDERRQLHEKYLEAEVEGYDAASDALADELESDGYPVCGKA